MNNNELSDLNLEIQKLNEEINSAVKKSERKKIIIKNIKKEKFKLQNFLKEIQENEEKKLNESLFSSYMLNVIHEKNKIENYDIIFNISNFYNQFMIEKRKNYLDYTIKKNEIIPIVSIIGNFDTGKSFILSEIADKSFPSGFDIETPSICGFKSKFEDNDQSVDAFLLDCEGFEKPIKFKVIFNYY